MGKSKNSRKGCHLGITTGPFYKTHSGGEIKNRRANKRQLRKATNANRVEDAAAGNLTLHANRLTKKNRIWICGQWKRI